MMDEGIVADEDWQPGDPLYEGCMSNGQNDGWGMGNWARQFIQVIEQPNCCCEEFRLTETDLICNDDAATWKANGDGPMGDAHWFHEYGYEPNSDVTPEIIEEHWARHEG